MPQNSVQLVEKLAGFPTFPSLVVAVFHFFVELSYIISSLFRIPFSSFLVLFSRKLLYFLQLHPVAAASQ